MLTQGAVLGINHVLRQQEWPLARLKKHAGCTVTVRMSPMPDLRLRIREEGTLESVAGEFVADAQKPGASDRDADLTITLRPSALPRLLQRDETALRDIDITGAADLASLAQELVRELRWDAEEDLSRVVGDVAAHRLVKTGRDFIEWQQEAARRLAQNFAEYWTEEKPTLVHREAARDFAAEVASTRDAVDALEARITALERRPSR